MTVDVNAKQLTKGHNHDLEFAAALAKEQLAMAKVIGTPFDAVSVEHTLAIAQILATNYLAERTK